MAIVIQLTCSFKVLLSLTINSFCDDKLLQYVTINQAVLFAIPVNCLFITLVKQLQKMRTSNFY